MANTLLDAIRQNQAKPAQGPAVSGAQVGDILQTKSTGKAGVESAAPAASNVQEQQAQQVGQVAQKAVVQEGQEQLSSLNAQAASQAESSALADKALEEHRQDARSRLLAQTTQVLQEYQQGARVLDANTDKARLEQVGFGLRLTNDKYLSDLHRNAEKDRLNSKIGFQEALARSVFADEEELFRSDMSFRAILRADDRAFQRHMDDMDINQAIRLADAQSSEANSRAMNESTGTLVSAGIQGATAYAKGAGNTDTTGPSNIEASNAIPGEVET